MDIKGLLDKASIWAKKYRYVLLVLLIGIALMLVPVKEDQKAAPEDPVATESQADIWLSSELLERIISQIQGAGKVRVLLTCSAGEQRIYQRDEHTVSSDDSSTREEQTVILTDGSRKEEAVVSQLQGPEYLGAVVVCQGADDPRVKLAVSDAVAKATGLGADRISVLKMK